MSTVSLLALAEGAVEAAGPASGFDLTVIVPEIGLTDDVAVAGAVSCGGAVATTGAD